MADPFIPSEEYLPTPTVYTSSLACSKPTLLLNDQRLHDSDSDYSEEDNFTIPSSSADMIIKISAIGEGHQVSLKLTKNGRPIVAIVDSGAGLSLISANLIDPGDQHKLRPVNGIKVVAANEKPLKLLGIIHYSIKFGTDYLLFDALVCTDIPPDLFGHLFTIMQQALSTGAYSL